MRIELLYFAQLKDKFGTDCENVEFDDDKTVQQVVEQLARRDDRGYLSELPLSFAVNEEHVGANHRLADGDRLAILTPVSGG